jgi:hypothetical protein
MVDTVTAQVMSVAEALRAGYGELAALRAEIRDSRVAMPKDGEPDDHGFRLKSIYFALAGIVAPDVQGLPSEISRRDVCAVVHTGLRTREARKQDALAMLRPAAAALRRAGLDQAADKIRSDVRRAGLALRIPENPDGIARSSTHCPQRRSAVG